jgi:hypothetical protein
MVAYSGLYIAAASGSEKELSSEPNNYGPMAIHATLYKLMELINKDQYYNNLRINFVCRIM